MQRQKHYVLWRDTMYMLVQIVHYSTIVNQGKKQETIDSDIVHGNAMKL